MARPGRRAAALLAALAVVGTSCSLINPHVRVDGPRSATSGERITLTQGIVYARCTIDEYRKAVGHQATLTSSTGLLLIPLAAASLGMGVAGADSNAILGLGLGGASVYGTTSWLSSKPRQRVYIAGAEAIACAVDAVAPLDLGDAAGDFERDLQTLSDRIGSTQRARDAVSTALAACAGCSADLVNEARARIQTADDVLATSRQAHRAGVKLLAASHGAGEALVSAVDRIVAEVDAALVQTEPDLDSLPAIIAGLSKVTTQFTAIPQGDLARAAKAPAPGPTRPAGARPAAAPDDALRDKLERLDDALGSLAAVALRVASVVNAVDPEGQITKLATCGVDTSDIALAMTVTPPGPVKMPASSDSTRRIVISGGKPPYRAQLLERPVTNLSVEQPQAWGSLVQIDGKKPVTKGTYTILIEDTANQQLPVEIDVADP